MVLMSEGVRERPVASPRRQQILDAAADLFARHGFHGVSINDIGRQVGTSGPALYRHFASKEAVLAELLIGISERILSVARERLSDVEPGRQALAVLVDWHVQIALDHPALITIQDRDLDSLAEEEQRNVRRLQRAYVEIWAGTILDAAPGVGEPTARSAAHAVLGLINSTPHSARLGREATGALLQRMALEALSPQSLVGPG
ncbi:TetR/AcrR family transcriptional regulator [Pseudactinotalea sp. Z1739]|uniref:TetR/AcrR family transcriptional regulator n=1 Tax=Pseudactinotalea sp. Z1739 TaxID=3413028 RepID=UPI003C7AD318